jgi:cysteine desulfuration protein SufE
MSKSIDDIEQEIVDEFTILGDDRESMIFYIMELGDSLPELDPKFKTDDFIIKGCQSKVWLSAYADGDRVKFDADSNTDITKGLISLLIRVLSGQKAADILHADLSFLEKIGMQNVIGSQRSNGLASMIKQMKLFALALQKQAQGNTVSQ